MSASGSGVVFRVSSHQPRPIQSLLRCWAVDGTWPCSPPTVCADTAGRPGTWVWRRWHQFQVCISFSSFQCICWELSILCSIVFVCMLMSGLCLSDLNKETTYLLTYLFYHHMLVLEGSELWISRRILKISWNEEITVKRKWYVIVKLGVC